MSAAVDLAAWRDATRDTAPFHLWQHAVETAALAKGAHAETAREPDMRRRLMLWYSSGEPVWMAADSLAIFSKEREKCRRSDREADALRAIIHRAR